MNHRIALFTTIALVGLAACGDDVSTDCPDGMTHDDGLGRCVTPTIDAGMPDSGPPSIDAGTDAGPPVCTGTATTCEGRELTACSHGCDEVDGCSGTPPECSDYDNINSCWMEDSKNDCDWYRSTGECRGTHRPCARYTNQRDCEWYTCQWNDEPACGGTPTACEELSASQCATAPGCRLAADDVDGGAPDAGESHAGTPDAG